jgi:two-component system, chemotaxis family, CheB/CheR fusion protein
MDADLHAVSANSSFYGTFRVTPEVAQGTPLYDLGNRQWDIPRLRELLGEILRKQTEVSDYEVDHVFPEVGHKAVLPNARQITGKEGEEDKKLILLAIQDRTIPAQKQREAVDAAGEGF